jgi:hypothetical protein
MEQETAREESGRSTANLKDSSRSKKTEKST